MSQSPIQALFQQAMGLHRAGRLDEAERAYRQIMKVDARDYPSRCMLGRLYLDTGRNAEAEKVLEAAVKLDGRAPPGLTGLGLALLRTGKFRQAEKILERAISAEPRDWSLRYNLGDALAGQDHSEAALRAYDQALAINPAAAEAWARRAVVLLETGEAEAALTDAGHALALHPRLAEAVSVRAQALAVLEHSDEAALAYAEAVAIAPDDVRLRLDQARLLARLGRHAEAAQACSIALVHAPRDVEAMSLRSAAYARLQRHGEALTDIETVTAWSPRDPAAHATRGLRLEAVGRMAEAADSYRRSLDLGDRRRPDLNVLHNLSAVLVELQQYEEALAGLRRILHFEPRHSHALGAYAHALRASCDWTDLAHVEAEVRAVLESGEAQIPPGTVLIMADDPALQLRAAQIHVAANMELPHPRPAPAPPRADGRLRIAYVSADFRSHPASRLLVELFETHDRSRFEVFGLALGGDDGSAMRSRVAAAFERFEDVGGLSDDAIVARMRAAGIDIAVDLGGFTTGARTGIWSRRGAPLQVNLLGFAGTLGTAVHDYVIADAVTAPFALAPYFSEAIAHLPATYMPTDTRRPAPPCALSRTEAGLPEAGFVFCSFNNSHKITPAVFDVWMRLLGAREDAALWLLGDNAPAVANLRREAAARGIDPSRLIFAPRVGPEDHLARHRLADLFLDTAPYGAHTTAVDALWMGLPVVTFLGGAFAARVGASLVVAVGLPELVADDLAGYERLALDLSGDPARLKAIRERLAAGRLTQPLFNADLYRRGIEAAYEAMWMRHVAGQPPEGFAVP